MLPFRERDSEQDSEQDREQGDGPGTSQGSTWSSGTGGREDADGLADVGLQAPKSGPGACVLPTIVFSQFAGTALWFAPNAVVSQIEGFGSTELAVLTSLVQAGFIAGTFLFTYYGIADRYSAPLLFCFMALLGAALNAVCIATVSFAAWAVLRFVIGFCLAGVYPLGMKIAANKYPQGLGARLGVLIGALALGTAFPWLVRGLGDSAAEQSGQLPFQATLAAVSALAALGAILMPAVLIPSGERVATLRGFCGSAQQGGPSKPALQVGAAAIREIWSRPAFRAAALGYWGHMFELYALWAYVPVLAAAHAEAWQGAAVLNVALTTFAVIGIGAASSALAGVWSLTAGRGILPGSAVAAQAALSASGLCCAIVPAYHWMPPGVFLGFVLFWGFAVVADSGQFSTLCAQSAPPHLVGSALTLTTCIGFAITIVSIQLLGALLRHGVDPGWALFVLLLGPVFGMTFSYACWPLHRLCVHSAARSTTPGPSAAI